MCLDMAKQADGRVGHAWVERVKAGGFVPFLEHEEAGNGWASPPADIFMVRGPEYFSSRVKIPGGEYLLSPLGFDWITSSAKISDILNNPEHRVRRALENEFPTAEKPFVWAFNLQLPTKDHHSIVAYFVSKEPIPEGSLIDQFLKGDDGFRNSRLKMIFRIVKAPLLVRKAAGEQAICMVGRTLACKYCIAQNSMEVDIDVGSSMLATAVVHLTFGHLTKTAVDLAFVIECQTETELPERLLGAVRFSELNASLASPVRSASDTSVATLRSSVPPRFLTSIGKGFSKLLRHGVRESCSLHDSSHFNGGVDQEEHREDSKGC